MSARHDSRRSRPGRWRALLAGMLCAVLAVLAVPLAAQPIPQAQLQVEAAFLVNFIRFTQWPPQRLGATGDPYVVSVVGSGQAAATVRAVAAAAGSIQGRRIEVRQVEYPQGYGPDETVLRNAAIQRLRDSHLVFLQGAPPRTTDSVLRALDSAPVLTVGDAHDFAGRGGMLGLVRTGPHVEFEANPRAMQAAGVLVSSKVMKLARLREGKLQ